MSATASVRETPIVTDDRVKELIQRLLYAAIHVEKRFTVAGLSEASGVSPSMISAMLSLRPEAQRHPSLGIALSVAVVLKGARSTPSSR